MSGPWWDRSLDRVLALIHVVADESIATGVSCPELAGSYVDRWTEEEMRDAAALFLSREASADVRTRTLQAERAAELAAPKPTREEAARARQERESERMVARREREQRSNEYYSGLVARLMPIINEHTERLRLQWTEELLASPFALPDGTVVVWGEATEAQHRQRLDMFMANAAANVEGASRHQQALEALSASGARTLNEFVGGRLSA